MNAIYNLRFFFIAFYVNSPLLCWNDILLFRNPAISFKSLKPHPLNELMVSLLMMCNFCRKLLFHFKFSPRMRNIFIVLKSSCFSGDKNDEFNNTHAFNVTADLNETVLNFFHSVSRNSSRESKVIFHLNLAACSLQKRFQKREIKISLPKCLFSPWIINYHRFFCLFYIHLRCVHSFAILNDNHKEFIWLLRVRYMWPFWTKRVSCWTWSFFSFHFCFVCFSTNNSHKLWFWYIFLTFTRKRQ